MTALADEVRHLDRTRLVSAALVTGRESLQPFVLGYYLPALLGLVREDWPFRVEDPLIEAVDLAAVNEYFGWYYSGAIGALGPFSSHRARRVMLDNMNRIRFQVAGGKPLLVSEFGAGALAGRHAPEEDLAVFSEEYQALVYRRQLAMLDRQPDLAGMSPWVLKDFRSPLRMNPGVQDHWNRKGLLADDGTRKQAFEVLRDYYRLRAAEDAAAPEAG
jgi:beta-glucuronidase